MCGKWTGATKHTQRPPHPCQTHWKHNARRPHSRPATRLWPQQYRHHPMQLRQHLPIPPTRTNRRDKGWVNQRRNNDIRILTCQHRRSRNRKPCPIRLLKVSELSLRQTDNASVHLVLKKIKICCLAYQYYTRLTLNVDFFIHILAVGQSSIFLLWPIQQYRFISLAYSYIFF